MVVAPMIKVVRVATPEVPHPCSFQMAPCSLSRGAGAVREEAPMEVMPSIIKEVAAEAEASGSARAGMFICVLARRSHSLSAPAGLARLEWPPVEPACLEAGQEAAQGRTALGLVVILAWEDMPVALALAPVLLLVMPVLEAMVRWGRLVMPSVQAEVAAEA